MFDLWVSAQHFALTVDTWVIDVLTEGSNNDSDRH